MVQQATSSVAPNIGPSEAELRCQTCGVSLRRFPYPHRAALAICSDIDETADTDEFLEIQRFLNTRDSTSMGDGVGLEIGNSFYFYDRRGGFSYFQDDRAREVLIDLVHAGYIDCLHTYGDGMGQRKDALRALELLEKDRCRLEVWINHHGAVSCFSRRFQYMFGPCLGDDPRSEVYHADATLEHGIRYVWLGASTRLVGQSAARSAFPLTSTLDRRHPLSSALSLAKELRKWALGRRGDERFHLQSTNRLMQPTRLEDGQRVHEFLRYCSHPRSISQGATSKGMAYAISHRVLQKLKDVQGFMIVYTHLGKNSDSSQVIAEETQRALRDLEREFRMGQIYVTTTSRLLNYYRAWQHLDWHYHDDGDEIRIMVNSIADPIFGITVPSAAQLQGLTFYLPDRCRARVFVGDAEMEEVEQNGADFTGRKSVSIHKTRLNFPY